MPSDAASALKPAAEITDHTIQSQIHTLLPISLALFFSVGWHIYSAPLPVFTQATQLWFL